MKRARVDHGLAGEFGVKTENDVTDVMAAAQLGVSFGQILGAEILAAVNCIILR